MWPRAILHCDINHCYAQIEEMKFPELKHVPMAVGGSEASRNGIILARNLKAKQFDVATAETLREALNKCNDLVIVSPNYDDYMYYTEKVKDIYNCEVIKTQTMIGGGTTPNKKIPSIGLSLEYKNYKANKIEELLRKNYLITRIENDKVLLDFRTILEDEIEKIEIILKNLFTKCN